MTMKKMLKIPLLLEPQVEGGWTITSPLIPELITEIDKLEELNTCVNDAVLAVFELYADSGKQLPAIISTENTGSPVLFDSLIMAEV